MKIKIPDFIKNLFRGRHKKRNIWTAVILILVILAGFMMFGGGNKAGAIQTGFAKKQNLQETVLSTGQVVSGTDLALSFQSSGIVRRVYAKEGDKVYQGQLLASLNQSSAAATLTTAQGTLAQAQANYDKLIAGANQPSIQVAQDTVNSAKHDLDSAYTGAINTLNSAYITIYNAYNVVLTTQNSYFSAQDQEGIQVQVSRAEMYEKMQAVLASLNSAERTMATGDIDAVVSQMILTLNTAYNNVNAVRVQCDHGTYYSSVPSATKTSLDTQKTNLNTSLSSTTTLKQSIASYKLALQKAEDQLKVTTAPPTQAEIDYAKAQITSAQGQVASAQSALNNMIITAPASGTITSVDVKVGELATASKEAIILQDIGNLHAEADVSEANVASLQAGQAIDYTFDALGPDKHFEGKILTINPASTIISGVVNYKVKGSFDNVPGIKPGMTANMTILVLKKDNILAVPSTAVINKNSKQYVRIITDSKNKKYKEVQVQTGMQADGGLVEIISGLNDGQEIVVYMKS